MKIKRIVANTLYGIGTLGTIVLSVIVLLRVDIVLHPEAMLPMQLWESAYFGLAIGFFPMLFVCMWAHEENNIRLKAHAKRNAILLFLPGVLCFCCFASLAGTMLIGFLYGNLVR